MLQAGPASGFGLAVAVQHGDGTITLYGHVNQFFVRVGQAVAAGERIAEVGNRAWDTLGGFIRTQALVALIDAVFIGGGLLLIGVPLAIPLAVLTFFAAFVPLIGAFLAGLVAVLIALVSGGLLDAALVLGAIIIVQQVEGHLLYPVLMGRTVNLHPAVIVVALAAGGILGGIVGVFLAVPVAGIVSVVLDYVKAEPPPESPVVDEDEAAATA